MRSDRRTAEAAEALNRLTVAVIRRVRYSSALSLTAAATLARVLAEGPSSITELARRESVAQPTMTTVVSRLARDGLVTREISPDDGRRVVVTITEAGTEILARRRQERTDTLAALIETLPVEHQDRLRASVEAISQLASAADTPLSMVERRANGSRS